MRLYFLKDTFLIGEGGRWVIHGFYLSELFVQHVYEIELVEGLTA
jgi:hypothetical protein